MRAYSFLSWCGKLINKYLDQRHALFCLDKKPTWAVDSVYAMLINVRDFLIQSDLEIHQPRLGHLCFPEHYRYLKGLSSHRLLDITPHDLIGSSDYLDFDFTETESTHNFNKKNVPADWRQLPVPLSGPVLIHNPPLLIQQLSWLLLWSPRALTEGDGGAARLSATRKWKKK